MTGTVTHTRRDGWQGEGKARGKCSRQEGASPPPRTGAVREKVVDGGTRGKGAGGMVAGCGVWNLAGCESAPRAGACDWPLVAMVAGAASTLNFCGGGGARGGGGVACRACGACPCFFVYNPMQCGAIPAIENATKIPTLRSSELRVHSHFLLLERPPIDIPWSILWCLSLTTTT